MVTNDRTMDHTKTAIEDDLRSIKDRNMVPAREVEDMLLDIYSALQAEDPEPELASTRS